MLRHDNMARNLTKLLVLVAITAIVCGYANQIKHRFCNANLQNAPVALPIFGFSALQNTICSETNFLPESNSWNLSYHQGGNGPWIPKVKGIIKDDLTLPAGCKVDQVHMVSIKSCENPPQGYFYSDVFVLRSLRVKSISTGRPFCLDSTSKQPRSRKGMAD